MTTKRLPVLFLDDIVLLPGMVVPVELDEAAQAAVDAARTSAGSELLIAPRLEDRYASHGVVASLERVGKARGGVPAAVLPVEPPRGRCGRQLDAEPGPGRLHG
ncbi:hypothetical protein AB0J83_36855 [Actinoplanes sp. NPDC049596]|uniref:hypothetical protein n=1 Tax=Actinoplanes sp. NPDC049596 TaxID=3154625 RepID=UPI0034185978